MKAHHHFADPEWDGEPVDNTTEGPDKPGDDDDEEDDGENTSGPLPPPRPKKIKVKLGDGKERTIQHMMATSFWHADGTPMSAQQFLEMLYGKLPEFFKNEAELREIWSDPSTRVVLLDGLAEKGFGSEHLAEMQRIIDAENSDVFDVLAHVAYCVPPMTREERAKKAKTKIRKTFTKNQQLFIYFVLDQYVRVGVEELRSEQLTPLLKLKYNSISDAFNDLGRADEIKRIFTTFQRCLYDVVK